VPVVCHFRDFADTEYFHNNRQWLSKVSNVVAISEIVKQRLVANGIPSEKIIVIYDGIDIKKFSPQDASPRLRKDLQQGAEKVIGYVGRLVPWKGVEDLIWAAYHLQKERGQALSFVFVGEDEEGGRYVVKLEKLVKDLGISGSIYFTGFRPDVSTMLAGMDIVVLPSHCEPLGNVVMEAMAMGKLVIATNDGGPAEIISDQKDGILVPPGNPLALAQAIQEVLDFPDEVREQISISASEKIAKHFSIQHQVAQLAKLYRNVVATK